MLSSSRVEVETIGLLDTTTMTKMFIWILQKVLEDKLSVWTTLVVSKFCNLLLVEQAVAWEHI